MIIEIKPDGVWYHGSDMLFTELRTNSTITQWREIAEAFSRQPSVLSYNDNGVIRHNGKERGHWQGTLFRKGNSFDLSDIQIRRIGHDTGGNRDGYSI